MRFRLIASSTLMVFGAIACKTTSSVSTVASADASASGACIQVNISEGTYNF